MFRPVLLFLVALLGACDRTADKATLAAVQTQQRHDAADTGMVLCAGPGQPLRRDCLIDRSDAGDAGLVLTLRHRDGGFRRLLVTRDGRGVVAADGAEPAAVTIIASNEIEVAIAGERYRLPATIGNHVGDGSAK